jgi:hypothetical protein
MKESKANETYHLWKPEVENPVTKLLDPHCLGLKTGGKMTAEKNGSKTKESKSTWNLGFPGGLSLLEPLRLCISTNRSTNGYLIFSQRVERGKEDMPESATGKDKRTQNLTSNWHQPAVENGSATISESMDEKNSRSWKNSAKIDKNQSGLTNSRPPFFSGQFRIFLAGTFSGWKIGTSAGTYSRKMSYFGPMVLVPLKVLVNQKNISQMKHCDLPENKRWAEGSFKSTLLTLSKSDALGSVFRLRRTFNHNSRGDMVKNELVDTQNNRLIIMACSVDGKTREGDHDIRTGVVKIELTDTQNDRLVMTAACSASGIGGGNSSSAEMTKIERINNQVNRLVTTAACSANGKNTREYYKDSTGVVKIELTDTQSDILVITAVCSATGI